MKGTFKSLPLFLGLFLFFGCSQNAAVGQGEERASIEGVWQTVVTPRICATGVPVGPTFPGILLFAQGGTMTGTSTAAASVYGLWKREPGSREYSFATLSFRYDPAGNLVGTRRITQNVTADQSGSSFTSTGGFQDLDLSGNPVASGCSTATGTRFKQ